VRRNGIEREFNLARAMWECRPLGPNGGEGDEDCFAPSDGIASVWCAITTDNAGQSANATALVYSYFGPFSRPC
jgi:hypothetical protein